MDALRYYIDGPGELLIVTTDFDQSAPDPNKILASSTCKGVTISGNADMSDVTGGRSLFPQRRFPTGKTSTVEFTDCETDWRYSQISAGEASVTGVQKVWAFGSDYKFTVPSTAPYTVTLPDTPVADTLTVRFEADGTVSDGGGDGLEHPAAVAGKPLLADAVLTFVADDAGKTFEVMYQYETDATAKQISAKIDSLPKTVKIIHKQPTFDADNKVTGTQFVEFFKLQPSPEVNEDYQERAAYTPKLTFELVDPKRADKKVFDKTWVPVSA